MRLSLIVFLFLYWNIQAQNISWIKVTYNVEVDFGMPSVTSSKLIFNNSEAHYSESARIPKSSASEGKKMKISEPSTNIDNEIFTSNSRDKILITRNKINSTHYWAEEPLFSIKWEIDHNTKATILGYKCSKATGVFRGRQYTVWFTGDIPTKFGPWKLNGLPGLILEASDSLGEVMFIAERIEIAHNFSFTNTWQLPEKQEDYKKISLQEYVSLCRKRDSEIFHSVIAKLPRDVKVSEIQENTSPTGYELKYEWEK